MILRRASEHTSPLESPLNSLGCAENGFMGMGIGAAMTGLRPIVEGMNMGFLLLAYNQISNNAGMLHYTSGGQYKASPAASAKQEQALLAWQNQGVSDKGCDEELPCCWPMARYPTMPVASARQATALLGTAKFQGVNNGGCGERSQCCCPSVPLTLTVLELNWS